MEIERGVDKESLCGVLFPKLGPDEDLKGNTTSRIIPIATGLKARASVKKGSLTESESTNASLIIIVLVVVLCFSSYLVLSSFDPFEPFGKQVYIYLADTPRFCHPTQPPF